MAFRRRLFLFLSLGFGSAVFFFSTAAWFHIQAVRWGYRVQNLRRWVDDLETREASLDRRLQNAVSLERLDDLAKRRYHLRTPKPDQIILIPEKPL